MSVRRSYVTRNMRACSVSVMCALTACGGPPTPGPISDLRLEEVASGLSNPLYLTAPAGDPRLFVVEQEGRIRIVQDGQLLPAPFLDITSRVASGGEMGLLGLA